MSSSKLCCTVRRTSSSMDLPHLLLGCLFFCHMSIRHQVQGASLSAVNTVCAEEGGTAVFPWSLTLDPAETLNRINWAKVLPTSFDVLEVDGSGTPTQYVSRASTNGSAFLILTNVTAADVGTFDCIVRIVGTIDRQRDEADLGLTKLPDLNGVTVTVIEQTSTTVTLEWGEVPVNETCDERLTYHVEYELDSSGSWQSAGSISGSAYGNTTLNFTVPRLDTAGTYKFGLTAENSLGMSTRVESLPVSIIGVPAGLSVGAIVGIVIGAIAGVALIAVGIWFICHGKNKSGKNFPVPPADHGGPSEPEKGNREPVPLHATAKEMP